MPLDSRFYAFCHQWSDDASAAVQLCMRSWARNHQAESPLVLDAGSVEQLLDDESIAAALKRNLGLAHQSRPVENAVARHIRRDMSRCNRSF